MQIKSIVAAAAIALIAGVGSVSADETTVADTAGDTGTPFALLDGIATEQMSVQELVATRGASGLFRPVATVHFVFGDGSIRSIDGTDFQLSSSDPAID